MGGNLSIMEEVSKKNLEYKVDSIATKYILDQTFKDMKDLSNEESCNNLVILTSEIINKYFKDTDIKYIATKKGIDNNDKIITIKKKTWNKIGDKSSEEKTKMCNGLAKYYVQIANIFAAISSTIKPVKNNIDACGNEIPTNLKTNICSKRLMALLNKSDYEEIKKRIVENKKDPFVVNPEFCKLNCDPCPSKGKRLDSEPGILELDHLYIDKYDYETGKFKGMSDEMSKIYQKDVEKFYKVFSGNNNIPKHKSGEPLITKFGDIKLKDFYTSDGCIEGYYKEPHEGSLKDQLFSDYATNILELIAVSEKHYTKLLKILEKIFTDSIDPETNEKKFTIKPNIKDNDLKDIIDETRKTILELYTSCEIKFVKGLEIYKSIVDLLYLDKTKRQLAALDKAEEEEEEDLPLKPTTPIVKKTSKSSPAIDPPIDDDSSLAEDLTPDGKRRLTSKKKPSVVRWETHTDKVKLEPQKVLGERNTNTENVRRASNLGGSFNAGKSKKKRNKKNRKSKKKKNI